MPNQSLKDLKVLAIDCQTTGNNARRHHLVEIGWQTVWPRDARTANAGAPVTHIVRQPDDNELPDRIQRLTGIRSRHFSQAVHGRIAWRALTADAASLATARHLARCPAVIHFARFELAFLRQLHHADSSDRAFPLDVICTHQLASRIWPQLPRKGLRAVAGYLGHGVAPLKRCRHHLAATALIWCRIVDQLDCRFGVTTWKELHSWLRQDVSGRSPSRVFPMPEHRRRSAPDLPGVYRFRRSNADLLYVGKARSLKQRVNSYFQASRRHSEPHLEMLTQAVDLDFTPTATALEAALLESDEIKRHHPPYNTALTVGGRELYFLARDFQTHALDWEPRCPLGPVPALKRFTALHALGKALRRIGQPEFEIDPGILLNMPDHLQPGADCCRKGLRHFRNEFAADLRPGVPWPALLRIGRRSWQQKSMQVEATEDSTDEPEAEDRDRPLEWTPQSVSKALESNLRHCGYLLRRSRWLAMLSEASIVWRPYDGNRNERRILVLQGGEILDRDSIGAAAPVPAPSDGRVAIHRRRRHLDLPTYDRLRVLTTELRRLVAEGRPTAVHLNERVALDNRRLRMLFGWI